MTASMLNSSARYRVPGVYYEARPRAPQLPQVRTDVAGFIGFERAASGAPRLFRCDDWNDFLLEFGQPPADGTLLAEAVRAFFANGGSRCYVATVRRPLLTEKFELRRAAEDMGGIRGSSEQQATGLERLLLVEEVSMIDVPDLYGRRVDVVTEMVSLPARQAEADFLACSEFLGPAGNVEAQRPMTSGEPFFSADEVFDTQRSMLLRCVPERWRVLLLLCPPLQFDSSVGAFGVPSPGQAAAWRDRLDRLVKGAGGLQNEQMSCGALYYPWVLAQERVDAPVTELPPTPFVAGVIARRDLARGPHVAPANETVRGVVGLSWPLSDDEHGLLYEPDPDTQGLPVPSINVLRSFAGYGVQVWAARTLSTDKWLRYLPVRRCWSAIQRRVKTALEPIVFEPNTPLLWLQVTQLVFSELMPLHESGALRGQRPEQSFYVRCDAAVNPPELIEAGQLLCEVGVAIAAPAEFLVFRIGRREGVVEVSQ